MRRMTSTASKGGSSIARLSTKPAERLTYIPDLVFEWIEVLAFDLRPGPLTDPNAIPDNAQRNADHQQNGAVLGAEPIEELNG